MIDLTPRRPVARIAAITAQATGTSLAQMFGPCRARRYLWPRFAAITLARRTTSATMTEIGAVFGRRDHTTIINAIRRVEAREATDPVFADQMAKLQEIVTATGKTS